MSLGTSSAQGGGMSQLTSVSYTPTRALGAHSMRPLHTKGIVALSQGERVSRDGAFTSRRGTGEGSVPAPTKLFPPRQVEAATLPGRAFQPNTSASWAAAKLTPNGRHGICCAAESWAQNSAAGAAWKSGLSISAASNVA